MVSCIGGSRVISTILIHDAAEGHLISSVLTWSQVINGTHHPVCLLLIINLVFQVLDLTPSSFSILWYSYIPVVVLIIGEIIRTHDLVVLMEVNQVTLSLGEVHIGGELIHSELLDDLEDVELTIELLLTFSKEFVLSSWELTAAETPWV